MNNTWKNSWNEYPEFEREFMIEHDKKMDEFKKFFSNIVDKIRNSVK